jgi:hypothetical protein
MAINRAQLAKELEPGLNALFGMEYNRYDSEHEEIFETETSDRAFEEEVMIVGFGSAPTKAEGAGVSFDNSTEGYTSRYTHETISLAFSLTEEAVEDNLYDRLGSRYTKALARSMANTKQIKAADRLMSSPGRVGTSDNDINSIRNQGMLPQGYVVNHYLTDTDAFFIKTDCPDGFKHFERSPMQTSLEGDFDTGNMRYKARERYSFGFSNYRCVFGSQGA